MTAGASGNLTNLLDLGDAWGSLHPQFRIVLLKGLEHRLPLHRILPCPVAPVACLGAQNVSGLERVRTVVARYSTLLWDNLRARRSQWWHEGIQGGQCCDRAPEK